jgi:hypothetical protein
VTLQSWGIANNCCILSLSPSCSLSFCIGLFLRQMFLQWTVYSCKMVGTCCFDVGSGHVQYSRGFTHILCDVYITYNSCQCHYVQGLGPVQPQEFLSLSIISFQVPDILKFLSCGWVKEETWIRKKGPWSLRREQFCLIWCRTGTSRVPHK